MHTTIALFRGINVGGKNLLPMKELVAVLESLGFENIKTYIQSGNVVMLSRTAPGAKEAGTIEDAIEKAKGFRPEVFLLSAAELTDAIAGNPFSIDTGKDVHFYFLNEPPGRPDMARLDSLKSYTEDFALKGLVFYLYAPDGIGRSKLAAAVEKALGVPVTARNGNTVLKLAELAKGL